MKKANNADNDTRDELSPVETAYNPSQYLLNNESVGKSTIVSKALVYKLINF
jgi:hypothetical protein